VNDELGARFYVMLPQRKSGTIL